MAAATRKYWTRADRHLRPGRWVRGRAARSLKADPLPGTWAPPAAHCPACPGGGWPVSALPAQGEAGRSVPCLRAAFQIAIRACFLGFVFGCGVLLSFSQSSWNHFGW